MFRFLEAKVCMATADREFLSKACEVVEDHLGEHGFNATAFAENMKMSRMHLHRLLQRHARETASSFIRKARLELAASTLEDSKDRVTDVCYDSGFNHPSYFARCFREAFGVLPSEYRMTP